MEKLFSGEESTGRYLDLNPLHTLYINLKSVKKLDYLQYLGEFDDFATVYPKAIKASEEYKIYLNQLFEYLHSFFRRAKPLYDLSTLEQEALVEFNQQWEQGQVKGWEEVDTSNHSLFCAACQKQFSKQTVYDAHLTAKKHIKAQKKLDEEQPQQANGVVGAKDDKRKAIAWKERLISTYSEALGDFREESKSNVERKQALTDKERTVSKLFIFYHVFFFFFFFFYLLLT
jgi:splicing factor 3A subunit 3